MTREHLCLWSCKCLGKNTPKTQTNFIPKALPDAPVSHAASSHFPFVQTLRAGIRRKFHRSLRHAYREPAPHYHTNGKISPRNTLTPKITVKKGYGENTEEKRGVRKEGRKEREEREGGGRGNTENGNEVY